MKNIVWVPVVLFLAACSSAPKSMSGVENAGQESIVSRIDNLSSRPSWVSESEPFKVGENVTVLGQATVGPEARIEVAYRISDNAAKRELAAAIEQKLDSVFQVADSGAGIDETQIRSLSAEATKLTTSAVHITRRYWEMRSIVSSDGKPVLQLRVFSQATMPVSDFKTAVIDSIRARQGKGGISADLAKRAEIQFDRLMDDSRTPSSNQSSNEDK